MKNIFICLSVLYFINLIFSIYVYFINGQSFLFDFYLFISIFIFFMNFYVIKSVILKRILNVLLFLFSIILGVLFWNGNCFYSVFCFYYAMVFLLELVLTKK